jgi:hypothetical protein
MARAVAEIEAEIRSLDRSEQERLLQVLLEELEGPVDLNADAAWLDEAQRRSREFDAGLVTPVQDSDVFEQARARIKR